MSGKGALLGDFALEVRPPLIPSWLVRRLTAPFVALARRWGMSRPAFGIEREAA